MKRYTFILLLILLSNGCISFAISGQVADTATTYYAMERCGGQEVNPLLGDTVQSVVITKAVVVCIAVVCAEYFFPYHKESIYFAAGITGFLPAAWNIHQVVSHKER